MWENLTHNFWSAPLFLAVLRKKNNWASTRENLSSVCEQQRRRPDCASAQSDQRRCYSLIWKFHNIWTCYKRNVNFLVSLCSWGGWFGYDVVANPEDRFFASRPNNTHVKSYLPPMGIEPANCRLNVRDALQPVCCNVHVDKQTRFWYLCITFAQSPTPPPLINANPAIYSLSSTPASNLGYLAPHQDNFSWVPNCSLGPPGWEMWNCMVSMPTHSEFEKGVCL